MSKKMIKCKVCGADIAKSASACPNCGAKLKKKHTLVGIVLLLIGITLIYVGINGTATDEPNQPTIYGVGEKATLGDYAVTLVNVTETKGAAYLGPADGNIFVICEFEIENNSNKDIAVSSMLSFEGYHDDYASNLSVSAMASSDKPQLDGTVAAGKKFNGIVGYEAPSDWKEFEVRFTPDFWNGGELVFVTNK